VLNNDIIMCVIYIVIFVCNYIKYSYCSIETIFTLIVSSIIIIYVQVCQWMYS